MNNKLFLKKLEEMKGKTFTYANKIHYIFNYSIDEAREKFRLTTNLEVYERSYDSAEEFLSYWKGCREMTPALETPAETNNQIAVYTEQGVSLTDEMIAILKDNIQKVQTNKEYIPQAQAINNNVNSIINLTKLKFDVMKQMRGRK